MMARRMVLALVVAISVSGVLTLWLAKRLRPRSSAAPGLYYVGTAREMEAGELLKKSDLQRIPWPSSHKLTGAFTKDDEVEGRTLLYPLSAGEPIVSRQLSAAGAGAGLSTRIPEGMRALSLKSDQVVGVAGFLLPGTHVDVLVTYRINGTSDPVTSTVLQDAPILAAGQKLQPDPDGKPTTVDVVTLLVSPEDAERAVLASTQGTVHFVLRNGDDSALSSAAPVEMAALGPVASPHAAVAPRAMERTRPVVQKSAPAAPRPYVVSLQNGEKAAEETFAP